jgi:hypothetical protein
VLITGQVDSSLERSIGLSVQEIEKFKRALGEISNIAGKANASANGLVEPESFKQANKHAEELAATMHSSWAEFAVGGLAYNAIEGFFNFAIGRAGDLYEALKRSSEVAGMFEYQRKQLQIEAGFSDAGILKAVDDMVKNSAKVPVTVATQEQVLRVLMGSMPGNNGDAKYAQAKEYSSQIMDLAAITLPAGDGKSSNVEALNEHTKSLAEAFAKARASGVVLQSNLRPLYNAGIPILPLLADQMGLMPDGIHANNFDSLPREQQDTIEGELAKIIKKRQFHEGGLFDALGVLTAPGGKAYKGAEIMGQTTVGMESSTMDVYQYFQTQVGTKINDIIKMAIGPLNAAFGDNYDTIKANVASFDASFDKEVMPAIKEMIADAAGLAVSIGKNFDAQEMKAIIDDIKQMVTLMDSLVNLFAAISNAYNAIPAPIRMLLPGAGLFEANKQAGSDNNPMVVNGFSNASISPDVYSDIYGHNIPRHAAGGIFDTPHLGIVGEAGTEAVTPLTTFQEVTDSIIKLNDTNQQLIDAIEKGGFGGMGGSSFGDGGMIGGVKITDYGYAGDSTPDWNSAHGIGDHNNQLQAGLSVALTRSMRQKLFGTSGRSTGRTFQYGGNTYRDDDTAPESDERIDRYSPNHASDRKTSQVNFHFHGDVYGDAHEKLADAVTRKFKEHLESEMAV